MLNNKEAAVSFGPAMQVSVLQPGGDTLTIELMPLTREAMAAFSRPGTMQSLHTTRYLGRRSAPVLEDELEWFDKVRGEVSTVLWGVWLREGEARQLIGSSGLHAIDHGPTGIKQATSGVLIFDRSLWGKGIARTIHQARTWYAFTELGITRIKSAVIHGNTASLRALQGCGYTHVSVERNTAFTNGRLHHQDNLECVNPLEPFWSNWWGTDMPAEASLQARARTAAVLGWANMNVTLL